MSKVSIIIPIYNVEKYLAECLDSCLNQTHHDIEIVCVNDQSPDNCAEILEKYSKKDSRIKVVNHEENMGLAPARNTGILNSTGDYLIFLDSDDMLSKQAIEVMLAKAKSTDADLVFGDYYTFHNNLDLPIDHDFPLQDSFKIFAANYPDVFSLKDIFDDKSTLNHFFVLYECVYTMCVWAKLYKRSIFSEHNILAPQLRCAEDFVMTKEYMFNCKKFTTVNCAVMLYRKHSGGFTSNKRSYVFDVFKSYKPALAMFDKYGYLEQEYTNIHKFYINAYAHHYGFCPNKLLFKFFKNVYKEINNWDFGKIDFTKLTTREKLIINDYKGSMIIALLKVLLSTKMMVKIQKEILRILPYFIVHRRIEKISCY